MRDSALSRSRSPQQKPLSNAKPRISETPIPLPEKYRQHSQPALAKVASAPAAPAVSSTPSAPVETPRDTPASDANSESPVDRLLSAIQEIAAETDSSKMAISRVHSQLYFKCKMRHYNNAKEVVRYYSRELLPRLGPEWIGSPWYEWLKETAKQPWTGSDLTEEDDIPAQTLRRIKMVKAAPSSKPTTQLPPSLGLKANPKQAAQHEAEEDSDDDLAGLRVRGRRSGKGATLRLVSSSKKRPPPDLDDEVGGRGRGAKSLKTSHYASDEIENMDDDEESTDDDEADDAREFDATANALPEGAVRVVVHAERLPTASPSGPSGTWTCEQEGCTYVVRSADEQDAQELIQEHFRHHEAEAEKINLAVQESRGHMPIKYAYFPPILLLVRMHDRRPRQR